MNEMQNIAVVKSHHLLYGLEDQHILYVLISCNDKSVISHDGIMKMDRITLQWYINSDLHTGFFFKLNSKIWKQLWGV